MRIAASLNRKFLLYIVVALGLSSALFLVLFVSLYRTELLHERELAADQLNRLLQASLENAMVKRDLDGLRDIVHRLGEQSNISSVMIVNPMGEVRFASKPELRGHDINSVPGLACVDCSTNKMPITSQAFFTKNEIGQQVLRSVNPVHNKARCIGCHGSQADNPVNGVLYVDYDAAAIRGKAQRSALMLAGSGGLVVLLTVSGGYWFMRRYVLSPVQHLAEKSRALAAGKLDARADVAGDDELGRLGSIFNQMAERLQASLTRVEEHDRSLQSLIDSVPDGIRVIDSDYTVLTANQAYCRQLGVDMSEAVQTTCYGSSHARKEPCPPTMITCPLRQIQETGQPLKTLQQHIRKDGTAIQVEVSAAPLEMTVDGETRVCVVESIRDLSRQADISHNQRLEELDRLASGLAHEIRNPLSSVRLALQGALRSGKDQTEDNQEIYDYLSTMDGEIERCIEVTDRLLKLSMPPNYTPQLITINAAIAETVSLLAYEAAQQNIAVRLDLDDGEPRIFAGDSEVRMVVLNLVQNAFHAMPEGGRLNIASRLSDHAVEMVFEDTGVGIRPEDVSRVYQPFFTKRADGVEGTGLGLTISRAIVERYKGRIDLVSRPGEGTRFTVRFPSADTPGVGSA
ncbi:MAG: ATP-binding protein [Alphaproteobacteria bacterium]|nr:ATP-binding protein [Alphaproteobacteria bacterium]